MNTSSDPSRRALDRVTVARRRAEQLAGFLSQAEQAVEAGDFETAVAACEEVLFLDPHNEVATRLIEEIRVWDPATGGHVFRPARLAEDGKPLPGDWPEESVELDMFPSETELVFPRAPELAFRSERELVGSHHEIADTREIAARKREIAADEHASSLPAPASSPASPTPSASAPVEDVVTAVPAVTPVRPVSVEDLFLRAPERTAPPEPPPVSPLAPSEWAPVARPVWTAAPSVAPPSRLARVMQGLTGMVPWPGWMSRPAVGTALLLALALGLVSLWAALGPPPADLMTAVPAPPAAVAEPLAAPPITESIPAGASAPETGRTQLEAAAQSPAPAAPAPSVTSLTLKGSRGGAAGGGDAESRTDPTGVGATGIRPPAPFTRIPTSIQPEPAPATRQPEPEVPPAATAVVPPVAVAPAPASAALSEDPTAARPPTVVSPPVPSPVETAVAAVPPAPVAPSTPSPGITPGLPADANADADARDSSPARTAAPPASAAVAEPTVTATGLPARPTAAADEERAVRAAVQAYTSAYTGLNADAVKAVYPGVNDTALRRAFRSLRSQRVELRGMSVAIAGNAASVSGTWVSSAVGQVGDSTPQRDERPVIFTLTKRNGSWVIVNRR